MSECSKQKGYTRLNVLLVEKNVTATIDMSGLYEKVNVLNIVSNALGSKRVTRMMEDSRKEQSLGIMERIKPLTGNMLKTQSHGKKCVKQFLNEITTPVRYVENVVECYIQTTSYLSQKHLNSYSSYQMFGRSALRVTDKPIPMDGKQRIIN